MWAAKWVEKGYFTRERPQHEVYVGAFSIGVHPVTAAQYQIFIDDGGYTTERLVRLIFYAPLKTRLLYQHVQESLAAGINLWRSCLLKH